MNDARFVDSVAAFYERRLVPMLFAPYADDLAARVAARGAGRVLEVAAGTGAVTRALALATNAEIVATDLNQPMLDVAARIGTSRPVTWRQADVMELPFDDGSFDAVVCQFGAMFFPSKPRAYAEVRRVLRADGASLFSIWDRIEDNELADVVTASLAATFPDAPPRFLARTPHGHHDVEAIRRDLRDAGFTSPPRIETLAMRSRAESPRAVAEAFCLGTPVGGEIDPARVDEAVDAAARAVEARFGSGVIDAKMQAHVVTVSRGAEAVRS